MEKHVCDNCGREISEFCYELLIPFRSGNQEFKKTKEFCCRTCVRDYINKED